MWSCLYLCLRDTQNAAPTSTISRIPSAISSCNSGSAGRRPGCSFADSESSTTCCDGGAAGVAVQVGLGSGVGIDVSVGVGVDVGVGVCVGVTVGVGVSVAVGVAVGTGVAVWVGEAVGVGVDVATSATPANAASWVGVSCSSACDDWGLAAMTSTWDSTDASGVGTWVGSASATILIIAAGSAVGAGAAAAAAAGAGAGAAGCGGAAGAMAGAGAAVGAGAGAIGAAAGAEAASSVPSDCLAHSDRSVWTNSPATSASMSPTRTTAAADAASRKPSAHPVPSLTCSGAVEIVNERVVWTSGSCLRAATASLSDSSSCLHSSQSDRCLSTRRRSESFTSSSMYDDRSSLSLLCLNLSNKPVKLYESSYSSRRIHSPMSSRRFISASLTRDLARLKRDFTVPTDTLMASAASL